MKFCSILVSILLFPMALKGQTARDVAVEIFTSWEEGKGLKLQWKSDPNAKFYEVYKRSSSSTGWDLLDTMGMNKLSYLDTTLKKGMVREYRVAKWHTKYTTFAGNGYVVAGYNVAYRPLGTVLIAIDSTYTKRLSSELGEYLNQLNREGWKCITRSFLRTDSVTKVKSWLESEYKKDTAGVKAILLLGRIPVPYSGNFRPDAHPEHTGAWPADLYYGSYSIKWTDLTINNTSAARSNNHNTPGDGKFDISRYNTAATLPSAVQKVELPVGRVDLFDMGSFSSNDTLLMAQYIRKNLAFRRGEFKPVNRGLIDDNFGFISTEAFASGGFRNFSVHAADSVFERDYLTELRNNSYLWSYGCGPGVYTGSSGVAYSSDFVKDSLLNPFTLLFGSYYGDWDNADNFLRAPLASKGWGLASVWSGRPYWLMHSTALGEPLHSAVFKTYNSYPTYNVAAQFAGVHVALMGDPTLKVYPVPALRKVKVLSTCSSELKSKIQWQATGSDADSIVVERFGAIGGWQTWKVVSASDTVVDFNFDTGYYTVSVRPKKLMSSASGSWWDMGAREIRNFYVNELPRIQLSYVPPTVCLGDSVKISEISKLGAPKKLWQWAVGNKKLHLDTVGKWSNVLEYSGKINVFVTVTSDSGCTAMEVDSFRVHGLPSAQIQGDSVGCEGTPIQFKGSNGGKYSGESMVWYRNDSSVSNDTVFSGIAGKPGLYAWKLFVKDSWGCVGIDSLHYLSKYLPVKPKLNVLKVARYRGDTLILIAHSGLDSIVWNTDHTDLTILRKDSIISLVIPEGATAYNLKVWAMAIANGCVSDTAQLTGIFEYNSVIDFGNNKWLLTEISPGYYQLAMWGNADGYSLELWSLTGSMLQQSNSFHYTSNRWEAPLVLSATAPGVVVLVIKDNHGKVVGTQKLFR